MENHIPVLSAVQQFLAFCSARNDSPNTIRAYNRDLLSFVQCIGYATAVTGITRKRIRQYVFSLDVGLKDTTVRRKIAAVRSFSNWLYNERYVDINPSEGFTGPRIGNKLPDIPSEADMKNLLSGRLRSICPERDQLILEFLYSCGLRFRSGWRQPFRHHRRKHVARSWQGKERQARADRQVCPSSFGSLAFRSQLSAGKESDAD